MMWTDVVLFLPLAVLTNTAFPLSFDPVLLYFVSRHSFGAACGFAVAGSACAGVAGVVDVRVIGAARALRLPAWVRRVPAFSGARFYLWAAFVAFSPLPFSIVRMALLRERPNGAAYALAVAAGRLPRYLLIAYFWQSLVLPGWAGAAVLAMAVAVAVVEAWRSRNAERDGRVVAERAGEVSR